MGLINQDNRTKQDLTHTRTPEDVMRRLAKNVQITTDEVKGLTVEVSKKVGNDEIISRINQSAEQVEIEADKIKLEGYTTINGGFSIDENGSAKFTSENDEVNVSVTNDGLDVNSNLSESLRGTVTYNVLGLSQKISSGSQSLWRYYVSLGNGGTESSPYGEILVHDTNGDTTISQNGSTGNITCVSLTQTSSVKMKKNFERLKSGLDIIKDIDIYKYNLKSELDECKKHIGFVIGDDYKYRKELTSDDNTRVDLYSFISVCCKAIQEQQEEIEELRKLVKNDSNR